ncbi:precorrin-2 dehydrogenase/sirohydrochlorin ferrochelatase family protein [Sphingobacterium hotanense]|uniref:precorrin-2 dehydrogenase/sirohydrochlorin ferrochelatase family protein n=1 Tax=Sphingobacterium hotanense TaxID=649196 RepID=UPI0021A4CF8C|nr:bifunctional precorrin-2 dehydrogenase/sirohydrochlorin ferrochelatase [Sphingobacterium hotanense]MCT1525391.1 bifunctional precorrin-2 dehydrogenase/sirohydrochlorin ferrochelatase [Sphingobacterium hotanense]
MNTLFPIYVKLDQINTLLIGGGPVGLEKLQALLSNSPRARVKIIARDVIDEIVALVNSNEVLSLEIREFQEHDLEGIDLLIMATNNPEFNEEVKQLAKSRHLLINVADKPDLCDFYLGSVVQKGNLKIGISTNGKSPTIAKRLKEFLNDLLPEEIDETLNLMASYRNSLKGDFQRKVTVLNAHTESLLKGAGS